MSKPSWLSPQFEKTFYDSQTLSYDDVMRLVGSEWLNDNIINYYFLYLSENKYADKRDDYLFICPSVVQWIKQVPTKEDVEEVILPLKPSEKRLIFIPICDLDDVTGEVAGGSHWALVVYNRDTETFNYYDSSGEYNRWSAIKTVAKIAHFIDKKYPYNHQRLVDLKTVAVPQQQNGFDCGVYLLAFADAIASRDGRHESLQDITPSSIKKLRSHILALIRIDSGLR